MSVKSVYFIFFTALAVALGNGCKSYYEETGASIVIGDVSAPIDIATPSGELTAKALYAMDGMKLWTSRGVSVCFDYKHTYTNSYLFGMVEKKGVQGGSAVITSSTNDLSNAVSTLPQLKNGR